MPSQELLTLAHELLTVQLEHGFLKRDLVFECHPMMVGAMETGVIGEMHGVPVIGNVKAQIGYIRLIPKDAS